MLDDRYVAGIFDGEGMVRCDVWHKPNSTHVRYQIKAAIGMNHRPIIEALHETYGGYLGQNRHDLRGPNNRIQFCWSVASQQAAAFLHRVIPHLIVKREQAEIALQIQASIDQYHHTKLGNQHRSHPDRDRVFAERAALASQMSAMKKETFPSFSSVSKGTMSLSESSAR